ncbi:hypothetical protein EV210_106283 [Anaerospora hongkongensis]|uniref:Uncharacterized protein n=1 Tax=Anaerospora hongkongensis TaxID=244830 RepID=A0A4R1Q6F6_9FIRM|nr:hypothetical protein EV210_106283 [Anaerospora hongkongensis]
MGISVIHTIEIGHGMSRDKLIDFTRSQSAFPDNQMEQFLAGRISELQAPEYQLPGFNKFTLYRRGNESYYFLRIVINPQVLLTDRPTVSLFCCTQDNVEALQERFGEGLRIITATTFDPLLQWSVHRIDYAMDLYTPHAALFVELAKQAKHPRDFIDRVNRPGSFYLECGSVTLNFYDKLDQMSKKRRQLGRLYNALCREATNVYRLEIQCSKSKRFEIMNDYGLSDISVCGFLDERIAQEKIQYYYRTTIGYGDYYSLAAVQRRIEQARWRRPKKAGIYNWLRLIAQAGSYPDSVNMALGGTFLDDEPEVLVRIGERTLPDYVDSCRREGINIVTIPAHRDIDYLPNPMPEELRQYPPPRRRRTEVCSPPA